MVLQSLSWLWGMVWLMLVGAGASGRYMANLQKQSLPQFQALPQSKTRLRWPLPIQILSKMFKSPRKEQVFLNQVQV